MIQIDMPMPDNCLECRFSISEFGYCNAMPVEFVGQVSDCEEDGKPEWCPLKAQGPIGISLEGFRKLLQQSKIEVRELEPMQIIHTRDFVPVVHGTWQFEEYPDGYYHWYCSECECWFQETEKVRSWNYCPNCGAKMDGERGEDDATD